MTSPFKSIAEELFKRQVKFAKGRYVLNIPLGAQERLNWIGSKHWALLQNTMVKQFGEDYYVYDYYAGKLWGHMFSSEVYSLVKTKRILAEMMGLISEQLGFGKIEVLKLGYGSDWATFRFYDPPIARESAKLFGPHTEPIDYAIAGLLAGSAEGLLKRRFITFETTCVGKKDDFCTFQTIGLDKAEDFISKEIKNKEQNAVYKKILKLERETDFSQEAEGLLKNQNSAALASEKNYLKNV